jgi:type VI secretion system secreted protein Hcp
MAKSDIHLKIEAGGESTDEKHKGEVDVLSVHWGVAQAGSMAVAGGGGVGRASFSDLSFVHEVDKASPNLWTACATGQHYPDATLSIAKPTGKGGQQDYIIIKMTKVYVTGVSFNGANGDGQKPTETVSLQCASVDMEYKPQKDDGSLEAGTHFKYDIKAAKAT